MSEYVANLNAIQPEQELQADDINYDDDLALFTNTNFFDFDLGQSADLQPTFDAGEDLDMKPLDLSGKSAYTFLHSRVTTIEFGNFHWGFSMFI